MFNFRASPYNRNMRYEYDKLRTIVPDHEKEKLSSYELAKQGFPRSTYYAIKQGKSVTTNTVNQLCSLLNCKVSDIMEYVEDSPNT